MTFDWTIHFHINDKLKINHLWIGVFDWHSQETVFFLLLHLSPFIDSRVKKVAKNWKINKPTLLLCFDLFFIIRITFWGSDDVQLVFVWVIYWRRASFDCKIREFSGTVQLFDSNCKFTNCTINRLIDDFHQNEQFVFFFL